jgi:hypothetical protein
VRCTRSIWQASARPAGPAAAPPGFSRNSSPRGARVQAETGTAAARAFQAIVGDAQAKVSARVGQVRGQAADALNTNIERLAPRRAAKRAARRKPAGSPMSAP